MRIWQASPDGLAVSAPFDGVTLDALPVHPGGSPGLTYAAWLAAAIDDVRQVRADEELEASDGFRDTKGELDFSLTELLAAVDRAVDDQICDLKREGRVADLGRRLTWRPSRPMPRSRMR